MKRLIIEKPGKIGFTEFKLDSLGETQTLARTLYSGLSHGTEMHNISLEFHFQIEFKTKRIEDWMEALILVGLVIQMWAKLLKSAKR